RVNLIGGKNNVGKTAFMEACYLTTNYASKITQHVDFKHNYGAIGIEKEWMYFEIFKSLIIIQSNREQVDFITEWIKEEAQLTTYDDCVLTLNETHKINMRGSHLNTEFKYSSWSYYDITSIHDFQKNKYFYKIFKKNNPPQIHNTLFATPYNSNHYNIRDMIDTLKIDNKHEKVEKVLEEVFNISTIDIIKNKVMLKENGSFKDVNYFGDGLKHFLHIILILLVNKDTAVYLDEVDNGIHYTNLDKLWEIILTISKKQNVQVFATTHSKECIESYARVAKRLKDEEIRFIELGRNKKDELDSVVMDSEMFQRFIALGNEVRGW
ncbi:MAG: ATP-binding protein, partial [Sulfurovum sp.]|nr:ATP-binding protein [Sulfurovum sp.]